MAKLYLVHFLGMQSRPWLQDRVVGVVINFLADWMFTQLNCLTGGPGGRWELAASTASAVQREYVWVYVREYAVIWLSPQLNCQRVLRSLRHYLVSGKIRMQPDSRFNYPTTIQM